MADNVNCVMVEENNLTKFQPDSQAQVDDKHVGTLPVQTNEDSTQNNDSNLEIHPDLTMNPTTGNHAVPFPAFSDSQKGNLDTAVHIEMEYINCLPNKGQGQNDDFRDTKVKDTESLTLTHHHGNQNLTNIPPSTLDKDIVESKYRKIAKFAVVVVLIVGYFTYFALALAWNFHSAIPLLVFTSLAMFLVVKRSTPLIFQAVASSACKQKMSSLRLELGRLGKALSDFLGRRVVKIVCYILVAGAMLTYVIVKNYEDLESLKPVLGLICIIGFSWSLSYDRTKINWRPVIWGVGLQMCLGLLVLRTDEGAAAFKFLGKQIEVFLNYVMAGVLFVFGEKYEDYFFIFKLMPVIVFLSATISIAYHLGAMQWIINGIASAMSVTMGTTAAESTTTAACIFLGQPEASLTIKPFLRLMTRSELFAILVAGFASVSADVFSLFVNYGMSSSDIITAVMMSAPAGLAVSKLICPEVEVSLTKTQQQIKTSEKTIKKSQNIMDAAATGAQDAVKIIVSVIATIIAFLSLFEFLNAIITYLGSLVNIEDLTLDIIMSYPLMPLVYLMGVPWHDCGAIGEIVGLKTFVNELVAYKKLSQMIKDGKILSKRSQIVAQYALCGFSNPAAVGVALGGLSAMAPEKKEVLAKIILMSWLGGCLACFMTASWAGLLYVDELEESVGNQSMAII